MALVTIAVEGGQIVGNAIKWGVGLLIAIGALIAWVTHGGQP